ncbi:MAG: fructose PTS transporter subunit IIB [Tetragenococcus koreensis]|uniref:Fructose-like phosphotransferase enzyme IIB component 2 n=2 Tax=Tetragenococcus halophilus TaxID=51669 RepID=A0A2H6CVW8_TETHA|nr:PTS fructose transporter subunit IIB [Tetragenococcus halophilus]MDN6140344.1 fructose PTS transporter subunit IIB [Tetragenococcus koreensis]MDN6182033.1 fructose PTS transporter subunit IIB [Staphylococcus equorum]MDN6195334.1 fructose PTS transporter subunit IIB [Atopostipes suicloacalis]MDN6391675.1 fructose PTS transporter subunit IIB [Lactococcus lactis]MDN6640758.1 fructose PTS transporter subunit IIB [Tetragenococcus sp.]
MKIVGVTACPTGIAHTYMAQEAIEKEGKKRGYEVKVETQGSMGIENELEQEEIDEADIVIMAVAIGIDGEERFEEKENEGKVFTVDPGEVIQQPAKVLDEAEKL